MWSGAHLPHITPQSQITDLRSAHSGGNATGQPLTLSPASRFMMDSMRSPNRDAKNTIVCVAATQTADDVSRFLQNG